MDLKDKNIVVVGLRRSGVAAAKFLASRGAVVTVTDSSDPEGFEAERKALEGFEVRYVLGSHNDEDFSGADVVVVSPGVPLSIPPIRASLNAGVEVIGELEMASRFVEAPIIGVTGTNGKSTVTTLIGKMLEESGKNVFVGGNIGNPLINLASSDERVDYAVVELSSFQLEAIKNFHPHIGLMLNVTPDHLDRYPDMHAYASAKARLWMNTTSDDWAVVNAGNVMAMDTLKGSSCKSLGFDTGSVPTVAPRAWAEGKTLTVELDSRTETIDASNMKITGLHNLENAVASTAAALLAGATPDAIEKALSAFEGLAHRTQFVREVGGVRYYDDSKGTNVGAVLKSLAGFDVPVVLIAGGLDKGGDFAPLGPMVAEKVKALVLIGKAAGKMKEALGDLVPSHIESDMERAVEKAAELAEIGEVVLLSPACASFDMFKDYVQRGEIFQESVRGLAG